MALVNSKPQGGGRTPSGVLASAIRKRIVRGEFAPNSQLPTWDTFEQEYRVGRNTLVRAFEQLKQQGFVYASSTRGTYVADRPPHLHNYALLFRDKPGLGEWSQFWWTLANQAIEIQGRSDCHVAVKFGVRNERGNRGHNQLLEEVGSDQYAGLIFVSSPDIISTPCVQKESLPKVAICGRAESGPVPNVDIDRDSFVNKSLDWLQSRGRRNIAVLAHYHDPLLPMFGQAMQQRGLTCRPHWLLPASGVAPQSANPIVRLLLCQAQTELPDALVVGNDNMADEALAAVVAMGRRVPEDLDIVTHCNWPTSKGHVVPTRRLGYDVRQILRQCISIIEQWRAGREYPELTSVPALFEEETENATTPSPSGLAY